MKTFGERFGKEILVFDGSMGTYLQKEGLRVGEIPETRNFTHRETVLKIHRSYIEAGCDVIATNTFGANRFKCAGTGHTVSETVSEAVSIAREAVNQSGKQVYVALSIGSVGKLLKPIGELEFEEAVNVFKEIITSAQGVDLLLFETFSDPYEMKAALTAAKETTDLPVILTMILGKNNRLMSGGEPEAACLMLESMGIDGIGFNCGEGPEQISEVLPDFAAYTSLPILCSPNAGLPTVTDGKTVYNVSPDEFAEYAKRFIISGASAVGGCCGTDSRHIKAIAEKVKSMALCRKTPIIRTAVSSRSRVAVFGKDPLIIGERINPTGKPLFKEAIRKGDTEYIIREGLAQAEKGAHILDVNVGLPGVDEAKLLTEAVEELQAVCELPLQIDSSDAKALESAMRVYNGKPLINSVNGTPSSMSTVFPLVKKYGGTVICLAMDETGVPESAEQRFEIIEKIVNEAEKYGIPRSDLIADGLVTSAATNKNSAEITLKTISLVKERLGLHTVLGISNISFGLPKRDNINAAFFGLALEAGLSAGIVNPLSELMMFAYWSSKVLGGFREQYTEYVNTFVPDSPAEKIYSELSLKEAIVAGLASAAEKAVKKLIGSCDPMDIINSEMIPALDEVGAGFEKGTLFLPQLLMAADAAKSAFEVLKSSYARSDGGAKIVLATVKGDIHDIGKNIVKALLENYGFDVIDLGKNVPPEQIVSAVIKDDVRLCGLSALMTTTLPNMAETIRMLKEKAPFCRIMVGGAVLTEEYASEIGADFYGKDAVSSVKYARLIL